MNGAPVAVLGALGKLDASNIAGYEQKAGHFARHNRPLTSSRSDKTGYRTSISRAVLAAG